MDQVMKAFVLMLAVTATVRGQGSPVREYIYFGNRQVAVEARANAGPNDLNYVAPAPNQRLGVTMEFEISDPDGGANTSQLNVIFGWNFTNMRTCYFHWVKQTNTFYLNNGKYGAAEEWKPMPLDAGGTVASVESDNCKVYKSGTTTAVIGATRKLTVQLDMLAPMGGPLNIWVWGRDDSGLDIGWEHMGTYTPLNSGGPGPLTLLNQGQPGSSTIQFQFHVTDPDGGGNLRNMNVMVNNSFGAVGACYFVLDRQGNSLWLNNGKAPPLEAWAILSLDAGTPASITSDYCTLTLAGSSHAPVPGEASKLAVNVNVQFKPTMAGPGKLIYAAAADMQDVWIGFLHLATWTIP